jgi:tetratricopeptide (TPR) repeat protein
MSSIFTPPEADQEIAPPSGIELLWLNHRGALLGGLAAVIAIVVSVLGVIAANRTSEEASKALLAGATSDTALNEVISKYPKSPAAADAMLLLAASLRDAGKLEDSDALYSRFAETYPRSPLAVSAQIGRASNARVAGKTADAMNAYQQASAGFPQSYGAPFALFSQARLLAQQGKMEEAQRALQALASQYPYSASAQASGVKPNQSQRN